MEHIQLLPPNKTVIYGKPSAKKRKKKENVFERIKVETSLVPFPYFEVAAV